LSVQYNDVVGLNESNGSYYKNALHMYWFNQYDTEKGMVRNIEYGRPYRRLFLTDYAINIHNRMADSRLRKSLLEVYYCTESNVNNIPRWTKQELGFAFTNIAPDSLWAVRYTDTVRVGGLKFAAATKIADSERVNVGDTAVVFLLNDENTTLTDRQMVAAGYKIYARYYWGTNADGTLNELVTFDRNNDLLNNSNRKAADTLIITSSWNRDKAPSLIKYWDRTKPGGYNASWGTRDVFIARLAESYLIGAEAYGRLGDYQKAADYINIVRKRAAYKAGEDKGSFWLKFDGGSSETKTISTENDMLIDAFYWDTDIHNDAEMYPEGVNTQQDRFIHFILNEKCREMLGEMVRWEDLKRTGTLISRAYAFNDDVRNSATLEKFHRLRPFPQVHLNSIQTNGRFLTPSEKNDYQNKGY
ncbi:MAG: RagB/SusD family nutrient uptake outer membrane protein, partial [Bacteroidales bacterium]